MSAWWKVTLAPAHCGCFCSSEMRVSMAALLLEYVRARFAPLANRSLAQAPPMLLGWVRCISE
jgi:hypothetical protein